MPSYTISITDTQKKCLDYGMVGIQTWIENAVEAQVAFSKKEIIALNMEHCNENDIAIATGKDAQVEQAYSLGVVKTAEERNAEESAPE